MIWRSKTYALFLMLDFKGPIIPQIYLYEALEFDKDWGGIYDGTVK